MQGHCGFYCEAGSLCNENKKEEEKICPRLSPRVMMQGCKDEKESEEEAETERDNCSRKQWIGARAKKSEKYIKKHGKNVHRYREIMREILEY